MSVEFPKSQISTCCFQIFVRLSGMSKESSKYATTKIYRRVSTKTTVKKSGTERSEITSEEHNYQRISTLHSSINIPKFQKKGLIFIWPQRKRTYHSKQIIFISWFLSHTLYWLHTLHLFPSGSCLPFQQPPWNYSPPARKPERRDFIIEPDWDSQYL